MSGLGQTIYAEGHAEAILYMLDKGFITRQQADKALQDLQHNSSQPNEED